MTPDLILRLSHVLPALCSAMLLAFVLPACAPHKTQPPSVELKEIHPRGAHRIAFDPGGKKLASGGLHGKLRIWSVQDGAARGTLAGHRGSIRGLAWLDGQTLVSADESGQLYIRDLASGRVLHATRLPAVRNLALAPDRSWLLLIEGPRIYKLALPSLQTVRQADAGSRLLSVAIDHNGKRVAVSSSDGRVTLMDADLQAIGELPQPSRDALDLVFSPDGKTLLGGGWFRLLVWDLEQQRLEERPTEHLGKVTSVDISPHGRHWLSLGRTTDSNFRLIDAASNRVLRRFKTHELCGRQARFSPDGRYVAAAADDGSVHIYDLNEPYRPVLPYTVFDE